MTQPESTRVAVYTDHLFWREGEDVYTDRVFPVFVSRLAPIVEDLVFVARMDPRPGRSQHRMPAGTKVVAMPWVESLSRPRDLLKTMVGSIRAFWTASTRSGWSGPTSCPSCSP
jgi:hypothetical protein